MVLPWNEVKVVQEVSRTIPWHPERPVELGMCGNETQEWFRDREMCFRRGDAELSLFTVSGRG